MTTRAGRWLRRRIGEGSDRGGAVLRRGGRGDRGSSAIEFVFLTPLMFFLIFGAVQFAMYSFAQDVAKAAAQAGARTARAEADADPMGWQSKAREKSYDYIDQLGRGMFDSPPSVYTTLPAPDTVRVEVHATVPSIVPGMTMTVRASSEGPVERFVPDGG
ncbi:TadE/TadG family type IV pilus assembly protein [Streptomyces xiamenensis]|uniref:TadE/TadG family type IV pilus assembly protein n=1 Tax=Streptomyces xiamenensis TaxID=408015 RepID=UPI003443E10F